MNLVVLVMYSIVCVCIAQMTTQLALQVDTFWLDWHADLAAQCLALRPLRATHDLWGAKADLAHS